VGVGSLLNKAPQTTTQQPSQSQFTQVTGQAQAQQVEKSNTAVYVAVGAVALIAAYYFISKRRR
jgi:multisubunit Na+/H+ antiporter MnhB subunit